MAPAKTTIYIDGFNLYHRSLKHTPYKWLDFKSLFSKVLPADKHDITSIKYFTSPVAPLGDPDRPGRQEIYIRALQKCIPELEIYWGRFQAHVIRMPLANHSYPDYSSDMYKRDTRQNLVFESVVRVDEKGSDVNLAMHLLNDGWLKRYDCAVLVSNDSDIAGALNLLKLHHPTKKRGLIVPFCAAQLRASLLGRPLNPSDVLNESRELQQNVDFVKRLREGVLAGSQLPSIIPGCNIYKPMSWCCGVVAEYAFTKDGLDASSIIARCKQKGYVTANNKVDPNFLRVDREFKSWFPKYTKKEFDQIQATLNQFH
ncbi:MAG: NYN domain-containing protein [Candidatus Omnitrophota bacterium]|nr:NYN domain-containing protein [Candidatus Omnitrophota bacterium]